MDWDWLVEEITLALADDVPRDSPAWSHYRVLLADIGADRARELVQRARSVEDAGGMPVKDGSRKRTLGGVFMALAKESLGLENWRLLR